MPAFLWGSEMNFGPGFGLCGAVFVCVFGLFFFVCVLTLRPPCQAQLSAADLSWSAEGPEFNRLFCNVRKPGMTLIQDLSGPFSSVFLLSLFVNFFTPSQGLVLVSCHLPALAGPGPALQAMGTPSHRPGSAP